MGRSLHMISNLRMITICVSDQEARFVDPDGNEFLLHT